MFLVVKKVRNLRYLVLLESVRNPETGKVRKVQVLSYGRYEDAPAEIRKQYEDKQKRKELSQTLTIECKKKMLSTAFYRDSLRSDVGVGCGNGKAINNSKGLRYGHLALKSLWDNYFDLRYKINYLQDSKTTITEWKLNDLLFYLTSTKIIDPSSYLHASTSRSSYFYCPWSNITQDNFYTALDFVYEHKDALIKHAVKSRLDESGHKIRMAFFDCTNTWFETPYDDLTWRAMRYAQDVRKQMEKLGKTCDEIDTFMESDEYRKALYEAIELGREDDLRMRGPSKEGRFSQPLVAVALAIDETGFPIDFRVFAGNVSEIHQVEPTLNSLKQKYGLKDFYFVADRGLNSSQTLDKVVELNLGFVVAQKVSQQLEKVRKEMLDVDGYQNYRVGEDGTFEVVDNDELDPNASRFKVCDMEKKFRVPTGELNKNGKPKTTVRTLKCKVVYTFSPTRQARDLKQLEEQIVKAQEAVKNQALINPPVGGWRNLVETDRTESTRGKKTSSLDAADANGFRAKALKTDVIENKRATAGYAAIVFEHPKDAQEPLTDIQVMDAYHKLVEIEECFRTMKGSFNIRPVHVRLKERVIGHCTLCVLALMMMRVIQERLREAGHEMSSKRVCKALANALLTPTNRFKNQIFFTNTRVISNYDDAQRTGKTSKRSSLNDLADTGVIMDDEDLNFAYEPDDTDLVLKAGGICNVPLQATLKDFKTVLNVSRYEDGKILSTRMKAIIEKTWPL